MGYWASRRSLIVDTPGRACVTAGVGLFLGQLRFWYRRRNSEEKPKQETRTICEFCRKRNLYIDKENQLRARLAALEKENMERNSGVNGPSWN